MTTEMLLALGAIVGVIVLSWVVFGLILAGVVKALSLHVKQAEMRMYDEVKEHVKRVDGMAGQYKQAKKDLQDIKNWRNELTKRVKDIEETVSGDGGLFERIDEVSLSVDHLLDLGLDEDDPETWPVYTEQSPKIVSPATVKPATFTLNNGKAK